MAKNKSLNDIITIIIEKDYITYAELLELGYDKHSIEYLQENFVLASYCNDYYIPNMQYIYNYANRFLRKSNPEQYIKAIKKCVELDHTFYHGIITLIIYYAKSNNFEEAFQYFKRLYSLDNESLSIQEKNYYLYLFNYIIDIPDTFKALIRNLEKEDILLPSEDNRIVTDPSINDIRLLIYDQKFVTARRRLQNKNQNHEITAEEMLEFILVTKASVVQNEFRKRIEELAKNKEYNEANKAFKEHFKDKIVSRYDSLIEELIRTLRKKKIINKPSDHDDVYMKTFCGDYKSAYAIQKKNKPDALSTELLEEIMTRVDTEPKSIKEQIDDRYNDIIFSLDMRNDRVIYDQFLDYLNLLGLPYYLNLLLSIYGIDLRKTQNMGATKKLLEDLQKPNYIFNTQYFSKLFRRYLAEKDYDSARIIISLIESYAPFAENNEALLNDFREQLEGHENRVDPGIFSLPTSTDAYAAEVDYVLRNNSIALTDVLSYEEYRRLYNLFKKYETDEYYIILDPLEEKENTKYCIRMVLKAPYNIKRMLEEGRIAFAENRFDDSFRINKRILNTPKPAPSILASIGIHYSAIGFHEEGLKFLEVAQALANKKHANKPLDYSQKIADLKKKIDKTEEAPKVFEKK